MAVSRRGVTYADLGNFAIGVGFGDDAAAGVGQRGERSPATRGDLAGRHLLHAETALLQQFLDAVAVANLPPAAREAFPTLDAVLIFSARSAQAFIDCVTGAGLAAQTAHIIAVAISAAAAKPLAALNFREVRIAAHPNQASVLDALGWAILRA